MGIKLKRIYEEPSENDGTRILVERLWPRGLSKEKAQIDIWLKEAAPSTELRKWFNHDPGKWSEFKNKYFLELSENPEVLKPILELSGNKDMTFVFASKEELYNNAQALSEYLSKLRV